MVHTAYSPHQAAGSGLAIRETIRHAETLIFFILLLFFSGAVIGLLFTNLDNLEQENPIARLLWYPIYLLILLMALRSFPQVLRMAVFSPLMVICVLWCGISMFWSIDPAITTRRTIALLMTTLAGLTLAARYDWNEMVQRIAFVFVVLAVVAYLTALLLPAKGIMHEIHYGAWRGPWVEKNYLGGYMTRGLIAAMCAFAMRPDRGWFWIPGGILCFGLVLLSTSKTALLVSCASIGIFVALRIFRRLPGLRIPLAYFSVMAVSVFLVAVLAFPEEMFGLIGKDPTFTGRTDIWDALMVSIREKFWLGYGYGVYWMDPNGPSYYVRLQLEWGVPTAHNGWMESWLSAGFVVVAIFGLLYVLTLLFAINRMKHGGVEAYWAILVTLSFLFFSMSESTILAQNDLTWLIFVATSAKLFAFERPYWRNKRSHPYWQARS